MSKINQIEKKLSEVDASRFHKLLDAYLSKAYGYKIVSNGIKLAEDKPTKGTPDSYAILENEKYVFAEYTTQKTNVKDKFLDDISKCLDEEKTGIKVNNIEKIILACNTDLKLEEIQELKSKCKESNIECEVFGNSTLANELFNRYTTISKEFLDISTDTQQILDYDDFVNNFEVNKYSTSLNSTLQCREKETEELYNLIEKSAIVLTTGNAGVGKTKLALEVCKTYADTNNFQFKAILNRGTNIFDDMISYFNNTDEKYLILIDDVNRIHEALDYTLSYFGEKLQNGKLKIVATIRDYAKDKIIQLLYGKINFEEFELKPLNEDSIKKIVEKEYNITHPLYLERISTIANGNPRLALMAGSIAKEHDTLESIYDVTSLYDKYFSNIKNDLEEFQDDSFLLIIVIVSFFRVVDKTNQEQIKLIEDTFQISVDELWNNIEKLNSLEIFDLYENEVVKVSDQILSTYLFYKIIFVDKKVKIELFLTHLFPQYKQRFVDVLSPLLNTFDSKIIIDVLKKPIDELWNSNISNETYLYSLMSVFWYIKQTDILTYFQEKIKSLEAEQIEIKSLNFWEKSNTNEIKENILEKLSIFRYDKIQSVEIAIELILLYFQKKPTNLLEVISVLSKSYGYHYESYRYGYSKESILLDTIWKYCEEGNNELFTKLFIRVSNDLLKTEGEDSKSKNLQITFQHFKISATNELKKLRDNIFDKLSLLYSNSIYKNDILKLIKEYPSNMSFRFGISDIETWDSLNILKFIENNFNTTSYEEVRIVHKILDSFEKNKIEFDKNIRNQFQHNLYDLEKVLTLDDVGISLESPRDKEEKTNWDEIKEIKEERLSSFIKDYTFADWIDLIKNSNDIFVRQGRDKYKFENNLRDLFNILAKKDSKLYIQVFEKYLDLGNQLNLSINLNNLIEIMGKEKSLTLLTKYTYNQKEYWLFNFYIALKEEDILKEDTSNLLNLYKQTDFISIPSHLDYLIKYFSIEPNIFISIIKILLDRTIKENKQYYHGIDMMFNPYTELGKNLEKYFNNDMELIKNCYLLCMNDKNGFDHDSTYLNKLISYDKSFLETYINKIFEDKDYISSHDIYGEFDILWLQDDYEDLFFNLMDIFFNKFKDELSFTKGEVLEAFLSYKKDENDLKNKITSLIKKYIDKFYNNEERIIFIFEYICVTTIDRKKELILYFLQKNGSFELFDKLCLEPSSFSWSGSRVPYLQKDKDFFVSLLSEIKGTQFLKHRQKIEEKISYIEEDIQRYKKRDFMDDF
jgi:hypothetical protein